MPTSDVAMSLDDNLVNGQTYTFTFQLQNVLWKPSDQTLLNDIYAIAPDFITSVGVTDVASISFSLDRGYRNITFTYEGDGSDVVSDVANSIIAAFKSGSNDNFSFTQAVANSTGITTSQQVAQVTQPLSDAAKAAADTATNIATAATKAVTDTLNQTLIGLLPVLALIVAVVIFVLPQLTKNTRISVGG